MQARRRRTVAALGAAAALAGLTACDRPTPLVTIYSGDTSIDSRAASYCFDGQDPNAAPGSEQACRIDGAGKAVEVLEVRPGDEVLVDVDRDLADSGWFVALSAPDEQPSRLATQDEHVTRFQPDFSKSPTLTLQVLKLKSPTDESTVVGVWQFTLVPG